MTAVIYDEDVAIAWRDAVFTTLRESEDRHGADPEALLDIATPEGLAFVEALDPLAGDGVDVGDPSFARAVEALAVSYVAEHPELRVTEAADEAAELVDTIPGRVVEAKGSNSDGGRVYRVKVLGYGVSRNGNRYTEGVMRKAGPLYEGARAYNHHRSPDELRSSTLDGLVGHYRNVEATQDGLYADLHLLPSAVHTAEALDATIANQAAGLPPLVGISHDVMANFKPATSVGGRRVREATSITAVQSADVVADPSAGGQAVHAVESTSQEQGMPVTKSDVLAAIRDTSDADLAAVGLSRAGTTTESTAYQPAERVVESERTVPGAVERASFLGKLMVESKARDAGLPVKVVESTLGAWITESDVDEAIGAHKSVLSHYERLHLEPRNSVQVTRESHDKKVKALDNMFAGNFRDGYSSFRDAFIDFTGQAPRAFSEDFNRVVLRESFGLGFNSTRTTESMDTSTWAQALGDSVARQMMREYTLDNLSTWRKIVRIVPVQDFRTQRRIHIGGYGTLPAVLEGGPYQPLTSPGDEEATYAVSKRGGTEDVTLEMIANDDVRAISRIPGKLGRAAARTVYEFVWGFLYNNSTYGPDSTALFHTNHANTDTSSALSQSTLSIGRRKMIEQTAYGDTSEVLGIPPKYLVVPPELEELAYQLTKSAVAVPSTAAGPSDTPNIHSAMGLEYILVPSLTDANDWFLVADPGDVPTLEIGFYQGREDPELFTQSDQAVGSMFNADKLTWKIRHIYSGCIEDYRGMYRGVG